MFSPEETGYSREGLVGGGRVTGKHIRDMVSLGVCIVVNMLFIVLPEFSLNERKGSDESNQPIWTHNRLPLFDPSTLSTNTSLKNIQLQ